MKKILYFSAMLGLLWACDPMEDTYDNLDNKQEPYKENISYTLVATDYTTASNAALVDAANKADSSKATLIKSQMSFNERFTGADYIGYVLAKNFPALNKGSVASVTYTYTPNSPTFVSDLSTNNILKEQDYQVAWSSTEQFVNAFTPAVSAAVNLPKVLLSKFPTAISGQYKLVEYNYSPVDAVEDITEVLKTIEDWSSHTAVTTKPYTVIGENGWLSKDVLATVDWNCRAYTSGGVTNRYAQISANNTGAVCESWMIKEFDLTDLVSPVFTFDVKIGYWTADCLTMWVSEDFDGTAENITAATWTNISSSFTLPTGSAYATTYSNFVNAGMANLSAYKGKKVYIGFKYNGDGVAASATPKTTTYQIDDIKILERVVALTVPSTQKQYVVYKYTGTKWEPAESSFVALQPADYTAMNLTYISTENAPLYLPNFLKNAFPYALEGDVKTLVYKSSNSNPAYSRAGQYIFANGQWALNTFVYTYTDQFIHTGDNWVFDPTVHLSPSSTDCQLLIDYVYKNLSRDYGSSYGNDEFYYGFSAYYKNIDLRLSNKDKYKIPGYAELTTEAEKIALSWKRAQEGLTIMLQLKYTEAVTDISGFTVYYWVTFDTYENSLAKNKYTGIFRCTKPGPDPEFIRDIDYEDKMVAEGKITAAKVNWNR